MIRIFARQDELLVEYGPEFGNPDYISNAVTGGGETTIYKVFHFQQQDIISRPSEQGSLGDTFVFRLGVLEGRYYKIDARKLGISDDVFIDRLLSDIHSYAKTYRAEQGISVFKHLHKVVGDTIVIGGDRNGNLPSEAFKQLVSTFPNSYELKRYASARIAAVVGDYFDKAADAIETYRSYRNRRESVRGRSLLGLYSESEVQKYRDLRSKLDEMLAAEDQYNEHQWQTEILEIIRLLYPKYIFALKGAYVRDSYAKTDRQIDILLIDASGHVDIAELKKPFGINVMSKSQYRDNYVPLRELSGTVMQVEKYIYYLNKSGRTGEKRLTEQVTEAGHVGPKIRITNPSGIIIMGRDANLDSRQRNDFEFVKRKYKNIIDIITYDDLLRRIDVIIDSLMAGSTRVGNPS